MSEADRSRPDVRIRSNRLRESAVLAMALLWGLAGLAITLHGILPLSRNRDGTTPYLSRFDGLRNLLPAVEPVGYLGDGEKSMQTVMAFMQTQYALAPVLVVQDTHRDRVVGNFLLTPPAQGKLHEMGLAVERDFGNGVMLLRRTTP